MITFLMSSHTSALSFGFLSRYAGRNVGMTGMPWYDCHRPRSEVIPSTLLSSVLAAILPSAKMIFGLLASICLRRKGSHAALSSGSGLRVFGGLHFTILQI